MAARKLSISERARMRWADAWESARTRTSAPTRERAMTRQEHSQGSVQSLAQGLTSSGRRDDYKGASKGEARAKTLEKGRAEGC